MASIEERIRVLEDSRLHQLALLNAVRAVSINALGIVLQMQPQPGEAAELLIGVLKKGAEPVYRDQRSRSAAEIEVSSQLYQEAIERVAADLRRTVSPTR